MTRCRLVSVVALASFVMLLAASAVHALGPEHVPEWKPRETIGAGASLLGHEGADRILAFDHHGTAGIVYAAAGNDLYYCERVPGTGWQQRSLGGTAHVWAYPSLAFDRHERPGVGATATGATCNGAVYFHFSGTDWNSACVSMVNPPGDAAYTSVAYDLYGRPALAYRNDGNGDLAYVTDTDDDGDWWEETFWQPNADRVSSVSATLAFDPQNRPMIVDYDDVRYALSVCVYEPRIGWSTTSLGSGDEAGRWPSLAVNPLTGRPAVASIVGTDASVLRYHEWNGTAWDVTDLESPWDNPLAYPSLAFDPADGHPAIVFYEGTTGGMALDWQAQMLRFAWFNGETWQTQTVDYEGNVGLCPSLAFNEYGDGWPAIAYFDIDGNLYYIEDPPVVPEPATLALVALGAAGMLATRSRRGRAK